MSGIVLGTLAAALWILVAPLLRSLPRPAVDKLSTSPDDPAHAGYGQLATVRFRAWLAVALVSAVTLVTWRAAEHAGAFFGLATVGVLAVAVDARTRYLPLHLCQGLWGLTALGLVVDGLRTLTWQPLVRAVIGATILGVGFAILARVGAVAFGDIRLVLATGAATAAVGWSWLVWGLVLGTAFGALWGIIHRVRTQERAFPYGPGLLLGAFATLLL